MQTPDRVAEADASVRLRVTRPGNPKCRAPRLAFVASVALLVIDSTAMSRQAQAVEASGAAVFEAICAECHENGELGAPRIGDRAAWAARSAKGLGKLAVAARSGACGMPPQEGYANATALEIQRAIVHMINRSGGRWIEPAGSGEASGVRSGKQVVQAQCALCHADRASGAPLIGDTAAWQKRLRLGMDRAVRSAIRGHQLMPPRGGGTDLTDAEIRSAITYMASRTQPSSQTLPANSNSAGTARTH